MDDNKIYLVRGIHPSEGASYVLANSLRRALSSKGFISEIISIPFEYTIIGWAKEVGMGKIPRHPLCLDSNSWPMLYGKQGYFFELHNTDFDRMEKEVEICPHEDPGYRRYDIEIAAVFKRRAENEVISSGLSILKRYLDRTYDGHPINMEEYSFFVDMESTKKQGFLDFRVAEQCANMISDIGEH